MLATNKIAGAFTAICEEAEKCAKKDLPPKVQKRLRTIISIAKHQSDIRHAQSGSCTARQKSCSG